MGKLLLALMLFAAATILGTGTATAGGRCLFEGDWDCYGSPQWNGPGLNTQNTPGTYGGWTTNPVECSPVTLQCWQVVAP